MFSLVGESVNYMLGRRTTMNTKMKQTCGKVDLSSLDPMEGSVALCTVKGGVLTKRHHADAQAGLKTASKAFRAAGWMMDLVSSGSNVALAGLADACEQELDAERELMMQERFYTYAKHAQTGVRIPKPLGVLSDGNGVTMEYLGVGTLRFCDCTNPVQRARAVILVSRLFFTALEQRGLVHGDISATNVLLDGVGTPCLVDFGCCLAVADGGAAFIAAREHMDCAEKNEDTDFVMRIWNDREWLDDWDSKLDAVKLESLTFNDTEGIPGMALYLRSLLALTVMARQVPAHNLRAAEAEWVATHPEEAEIQRRRKEKIHIAMLLRKSQIDDPLD